MCHECLPTHPMKRMGYCGCRFRQFLSPEEEIELLEGYREQLRKEIVGVEKKIDELKKRG